MTRIYHFLGTVYFAIILISTTLLFVIAGTIIESHTGSHQHAAFFTYQNPIFSLLLWGFFLNILISALHRWPFKTKHIPFLITHFGLLMILGGALTKSYYGVQGVMHIAEGSGTQHLLIPETYALLIENKDPVDPLKLIQSYYSLDSKFKNSENAITIELISLQPHSKEVFHTVFDEKPLESEFLKSVIVYDRGFAGYTVKANSSLKPTLNQNEENVKGVLHALTKELNLLNKASPDLVPPLLLFHQACQKTNTDFGKCLAEFLSGWHQSGHLIYSNLLPMSSELTLTLQNIDWKQTSTAEKASCATILTIADELDRMLDDGEDFIAILEKKGWPLLEQFNSPEYAESESKALNLFFQQLFAAGQYLPLPKELDFENLSVPLQSKLISSYLRAHQIYLKAIVESFKKEEIEQFIQGMHQENANLIEMPLQHYFEPAVPSIKWEENKPLVTFWAKKNGKKEAVQLAYDRNAQGLKWPALKGNFLFRFQPYSFEIPYRIRLHQARSISYPNSTQPYSYESDLFITDLTTKEITEKTISMNNVYETWDGYRFYLSHIHNHVSGLKSIQLVVNYDPGKYWLTYPGAVILCLGVFLLFWLAPKRS